MIFCGSTLPSCSIATAALSVSSYHVRACYRFWHEPHQRPIMCERDRKGQDARVLPICNELQLPLWYNYPCLVVEHASLTSAFATLPARIPDCDADFRLEVQQLTSISLLTLPVRWPVADASGSLYFLSSFFPAVRTSVHKAEIQLPPLDIDAHHADLYLIAEPITLLGTAANQAVVGLLEIVIIIGQCADMDQSLDRPLLGLGVETVVRHAGDDRLQLQSQSLFKIGQQFQLD